MKSKTIVFIAIVMAFAMVMPVSAFVSNADPEVPIDDLEPTDDSSGSSFLNLPVDKEGVTKALIAILTEKPEEAKEEKKISTDTTIGSGEVEIVNYDYVFTEGATLTVKAGGYFLIVISHAFSFTSADKFAEIIFEEGSNLAILTKAPLDEDEKIDTTLIEDLAVWQKTFEFDESFCFKGSMSYGITNDAPLKTVSLKAASGFAVRDDAADDAYTTESVLTKDSSVSAKITTALPMTVEAVIDAEAIQTMHAQSDAKVENKFSVNSVTNVTANYSEKALTADIVTNSTITASSTSDGVSIPVTLKVDGDVDVKLADFDPLVLFGEGSLDGITPEFAGTLTLTFAVGNFTDYQAGKAKMTAEGLTLKASATIDSSSVAVAAELSAGKLAVDSDSATNPVSAEISNLFLGIGLKLAKVAPTPVPTGEEIVDDIDSGLMPGVSMSPASMIATMYTQIATAYVEHFASMTDEERAKLTDADYNVFAFDSIFGMVNPMIAATGYEVSEVSLKASVGKAVVDAGPADITADNASFEAVISKDSGISVNVKVGYAHAIVQTVTKMVVYLQNVEIDVMNSKEKDTFLDISVKGDFDVIMYANGKLNMEIYFAGVQANARMGADPSKPVIPGLSVDTAEVTQEGVVFAFEDISFDNATSTLKAKTLKVSGSYYGKEYRLMGVSGTMSDYQATIGGGMTIGSYEITATDVNGNTIEVTKKYDSAAKEIVTTVSTTGPFWARELFLADGIDNYLNAPIAGADASATDRLVVTSGQLIFSENNSDIAEKYGFEKITGEIYLASADVTGFTDAFSSITLPDGTEYTFSLVGCALGLVFDKDAVASYKVFVFPGFGTEFTNLKNIKVNADLTAEVTDTANISCTASADVFEIILDGKSITKEAKADNEFVYDVGAKVVAVVDANGAIVGSVADSKWTYTRHMGTGTLNLTTVEAETIDSVIAGLNTVQGKAVSFTAPTLDVTNPAILAFSDSGLRFEIKDATYSGQPMNVIAQQTQYNGKNAFIVKVLSGEEAVPSTFCFPIEKDNMKLMHVDEFGRVSTLASDVVTIDGKMYLQADMSDYSILYVEEDNPHIGPQPTSSESNLLVFVGAAVAALAIIAVVVFFVVRSKKA